MDGNLSDTRTNTSYNANKNTDAEFWSAEALNKIAPVLLVMIATIIGNLVLIVLISHKQSRRRKRVNVFIVNLAVADLTVAFITMTTELLEAVFKEWVLGAFLCKFLLYFQVVTLSSTTFLLTGMSIDRYQVIVRPLQSLAQRPKIKSKVVIAWFMALIFAIPQVFIFVQVKEYTETKQMYAHFCKSLGYSAEWQRKIYFTFLTFYILVLPAGIMLFCYTAIAKAIWNRGEQSERSLIKLHNRDSSSPRMSMKSSVISASRRKVVFMTLSVIIAYIVCLTPYFIICLIRIYSHYSLDLRNELAVSQTIFMLHSALNPILYGLFTLRSNHISMICSYCTNMRDRLNWCCGNDDTKPISKKTRLYSLRRNNFRFRAKSSGEASVIIANHVAKEETHIKLRNRENSRHIPSCHINGNNKSFSQYSQSNNWYHSNNLYQGTISAETFPVTVHMPLSPGNATTISDV